MAVVIAAAVPVVLAAEEGSPAAAEVSAAAEVRGGGKLVTENDSIEDLIFDFLGEVTEPFTLKELFESTGIEPAPKIEEETRQLLLTIDEFVEDGDRFHPKALFLSDIPIRIMPTEYEIQEGILIPGHRLLPFHAEGLLADEISFTTTGKTGKKGEIKTQTISMKMPDLHVYFSLMDLQKIPILNIEDILDDNADLNVQVCRMKTFYKSHKFQFGDSLILRAVNFNEGVFSIEYDSYENYEARIFEIEKMDRAFIKVLNGVIKRELFFPNVEKQLLYTYYTLKQDRDYKWEIPGTALGPLLAKTGDIVFSALPNGRTVFHFRDQSLEDLAVYPDFEEILDEIDDEELDLATIEGILKFLNNNNGITIVRALLFDAITKNKRFNYTEIENYLFDGLEKPYMPREFKKIFKALVQDEYRKVKKEFRLEYAYLPITTAREKLLEQALVVSRFLRYLDEEMVELGALPKNEMMHLMELDHVFEEILEELDSSQVNGECDSTEVHRIVKIVDRVSAELPGLFEAIRLKLGL
ncbi:MAG: hypothetical protein GY940_31330 [bacterium]|nr:hypothetical protein [bacterium]